MWNKRENRLESKELLSINTVRHVTMQVLSSIHKTWKQFVYMESEFFYYYYIISIF